MRSALPLAIAVLFASVGLASTAPAQVAPTPVDFTPFADGKNWIVKQPLVYRVGISKDSVIVPPGFVTDLASIPPVLQSLIQQNGPYLLPAVVHDYLYWEQGCTREQADQLLLLAMIENQVGAAHRRAIYDAVRAAGGFAWRANAQERAADQPRIIPEGRRQIPALTKWPEYRAQLKQAGIGAGPHVPIAPAFCARGSMPTQQALQTP